MTLTATRLEEPTFEDVHLGIVEEAVPEEVIETSGVLRGAGDIGRQSVSELGMRGKKAIGDAGHVAIEASYTVLYVGQEVTKAFTEPLDFKILRAGRVLHMEWLAALLTTYVKEAPALPPTESVEGYKEVIVL